MLNGGIVDHGSSGLVSVLIVSSPAKVYTASRNRMYAGMEAMGRRSVLIREPTSDAKGRER